MKSLRRIRLHNDKCKVDDDLLQRSMAARVGHWIIQFAVFVRAIEPALVLAVTVLLVTVPVFAQQPGGNIFGGNDQQLGSGVREAIRWGRNLLFLLGVGGVGWGAANIMMEKAWGRQMLGGGICMGIGGILSLVYSFSQGNAVNFATTLICYLTPFLFGLKLWGVPLELWTGLGSAALSIAFFNFARIGRRPFWLQHRLRAIFTSPIHRRALPMDSMRRPRGRWIIAQ